MNDDLLEFCMYHIMLELRLRGLPTTIEVSKIIEYIKFVMKNYEDVTDDEYEDDFDESIEEDEEFEYDESVSLSDAWSETVGEENITEQFIRNKIKDTAEYNSNYFNIDTNDSLKLKDGVSTDELEDVHEKISEKINKDYYDLLSSDIELLETIGVNLRDDIADELIRNENSIQELYLDSEGSTSSLLACYLSGEDDSTIKKLISLQRHYNMLIYKGCSIKLSRQECSDLVKIIEYYYGEQGEDCDSYPLHSITMDAINYEALPTNIFLQAIFLDEEMFHSVAIHKIKKILLKEKVKEDKNFYTAYLFFLNEEIKKIKASGSEDEEFIECLSDIKYRLMYVLDSLCNANLFREQKSYTFELGDRFADPFTYILIKDVLNYKDVQYRDDYEGKVGIANRLNNLLKKIFIMTDYCISGDDSILECILEEPMYQKNLISSKLLEEVVALRGKDRKKILQKNKRQEN